ncbi:hypothetical protein O1611_g10254 [Lasiodiplodia mahajangana]|uniref:Uncharacterized protein n=1 Tax=Lasiodiplodia mahajangana TaxID=1108764 RepID=A0ACC2J0J8_9PEZI|nr:hypothetical protein O1611_g10254 [Lasiodiplodia mahajangana]
MAAKKPSISVHVKLAIDPSKTEEFLRALRPTFEEISADPLNTFIEIYRDDKNPGIFKLVENWDVTPEYMLNVQTKKDFYKTYYAAIKSILLGPPEPEIFSRMPDNLWVSVAKDSYPDRC